MLESNLAPINYQVPGGALHENVFVFGSDGNVYLIYWDGSSWNSTSLGTPATGVNAIGAFGVINY